MAIGRYRHGADVVRMAFQRPASLARFQIPEPQRPIPGS